MRIILLFSFMLFKCLYSSAQEFKVDAAYAYMYSSQLDKAIQSYNFTRPILTEKQPLLTNGLNTSISTIFRSENHFKHGINFSYAYFRSWAENKNFSNQLNLHIVNLGYLLHYENPEKCKGLYSDLIVSVTSCLLYRAVNEELFVYDETLSKAFGIGGNLQLKFGYSFKLRNNSFLSPFLSFAYTPYLFSPNNEAVINQTKGLVCKNWTEILTAQCGLTIHLKK
jgi:hypothetical protein